jgi:hypothetical protein
LADLAFGLTRYALPAGLVTAAACVIAIRLGAHANLLWLTALPLPALVSWVWLRPRPLRRVARRVDDHYKLDDQLGSTLELQPSDDPRTQAIVTLATERAHRLAAELDPRPVVAVRIGGLRWLDAVALGLVIAALYIPDPFGSSPAEYVPPRAAPTTASTEPRAGVDMTLAEPLRHDLRSLQGKTDESAAAASGILEVLEALETGELDRAEALARLEELESQLADAEQRFDETIDEDPNMLAEAMREFAEALKEQDLTERAGESFDEGEGDKGEEQLNDAAEQAVDDEAARKELERALKDAEKRLKDASAPRSDTARELAEAERRLRREQERKDGDPQERERRLKQQKERVEQLRRQHEREMAAQRRLDQLRRDSAAASAAQNGQARRDAVQKLSRGANQASNTASKTRRLQQARDAIEEAKTFVRRAGDDSQSGNRRKQQAQRFSKAAKGQRKGDKKGPKSTLLVEGEVGEGEPDMLIEQPGNSPGDSSDEGGDPSGEGDGQDDSSSPQPSDGIGDSSVDPLGERSGKDVRKRNLEVEASGRRGISRAQVIRDSSQQGFASEPYRQVFHDYRSFAQSALDTEALPAAKRRTVKRYYRLIQPRD